MSFRKFLRYFLWLGTFGFGGPIATVGYMQRDLVEQRGWLAKQYLLDGIAPGQTTPGCAVKKPRVPPRAKLARGRAQHAGGGLRIANPVLRVSRLAAQAGFQFECRGDTYSA